MDKTITIGESGNEAKRSKIVKVDGIENIDGQDIQTTWDKQDLELPTTRIDDYSATGEKIIIRSFKFALPPPMKGVPRVTPQEMVDHHRGKITAFLFKDGLEICGDFRTLRKGKFFFIIVPAKPTFRGGVKQIINEQADTLNKILNG